MAQQTPPLRPAASGDADPHTASVNVQPPSNALGYRSPYWDEGTSPEKTWARAYRHAHPVRPDHHRLIQQAIDRWGGFISAEGIRYASTLQLRPLDVVVATHSKAGTTLMQQVVHQLRSGGDEAFDDISLVVPWIEPSFDMGLDLNAPIPGSFEPPRAFKTHFGWKGVPKTGLNPADPASRPVARYLCVVRDPHDIMASFYPFLLNWFYTAEELRLCDFVEVMIHHRGVPYWDHVAGWYEAAETYPEQILFLFYEDIVKQPLEMVRRVASFIGMDGLPDLEARIHIAHQNSSLAYMKTHARQFDDHALKERRNTAFGAVGAEGVKVNVGGSGRGRDVLGPDLAAELDEALARALPSRLGVHTYTELRAKAARSDRLNLFRLKA